MGRLGALKRVGALVYWWVVGGVITLLVALPWAIWWLVDIAANILLGNRLGTDGFFGGLFSRIWAWNVGLYRYAVFGDKQTFRWLP